MIRVVRLLATQKTSGKRIKIEFVSSQPTDETAIASIKSEYDFDGLTKMQFEIRESSRTSHWIGGDMVPLGRK